MNARNRKNVLLSAALAVPLALASVASAQFQVNNGDALDASNRVGSGGQNEVGRTPARVSNEDIVYGNVTAGREFRGGISTFDAREFRGGTSGGQVDAFVRNTAGVPTRGMPRTDLTTPQTFFGDSRGVAPPAGAIQNGFAGGAILPSDALRTPSGAEITGRNIAAGPLGSTLLMPGGMGNNNRETMFAGSPLSGVREVNRNQWTQDLATDFLRRNPNEERWTPEVLERFQQELREAADSPTFERPADSIQQPTDALRNDALRPFESPENNALRSGLQPGQIQTAALGSNLQTGTAPHMQRLPSAAQQSTQYAELERRLQRFRPAQTEADRARAYREQLRQAAEGDQQAAQGQQPGQAQRGGQPQQQLLPRVAPGVDRSTETQQQAQVPQNLPTPRPDEEPVQIKSLADGVKAEGLANVLRQAEENMQKGKFLSAVQDYDRAQQVAPNNPLIQLGRAHAMLGGSYFARADQALRQAFAADPALLMAQYDLRSMIGEKRLNAMIDDLKTIANTEKNAVQPVFLLAYIAYNTDNEAMAAEWLNEAARRANNRDAIVNLMRQYWNLPQSNNQDAAQAPRPDLNK